MLTGDGGVIATSTDAQNFVIKRSVLRSDLSTISRVRDLSPSYFVAGSAGAMFQGDPWTDAPWEGDESASTDRTMGQVFEMKGRASASNPAERWLTARASMRGLYERDFEGQAWRRMVMEPPSSHSLCARVNKEACGFTAFPTLTSEPQLADDRVVVATEACPQVLLLERDQGCASSIQPNGGWSEDFNSNGPTAVDGRDLLVVVSRGVVALPLD